MAGNGGASELELHSFMQPEPTESLHAGAGSLLAPTDSLAAQSGPRRIPGPAGQAQGGGGGGAQPGGATAAPPDPDFLSQPWLTALSCLDLEDFDERQPLLQHTVRTAAGFAKSGKLSRLLAVVVVLQRTYSGQAFVRLKDPTGCIGGTISQQALEAEPGIQPGSVLILEKVTVLRLPSLRPLHHVCITLDNIAQVIPAAPAAASQPAVLAAPAAWPLSVPLLPAPAAPSTAGGPALSWLGPSPSPALTMSSAGSLVAGAPPGGRQGWGGAQGPRHAAGPGPSQMATPCSQLPQLAQPQFGQRHGQHMGVQLQAGSYGGVPPGQQQQQGQQRGGCGGLPPVSQGHSEQGQHMGVQLLVFGGQPPPQQQQHQAGRAQFSGPQVQQPSAPPAFSQGLAGGRSQQTQTTSSMHPRQAQPTSSMRPQQAQPTNSMQPPPPRFPLGNLSNSQQWAASQGGPAGTQQQQQQQHVTSRGAAWLQGLLQELPPSDGFGCSQQPAASEGQPAATQADTAGGAPPEREAKRSRVAEPLFGDGIDELMDGLEDELGL